MTSLVDVSQAARELFDEVRKLWHYAPRGTPDGYWFERSERGRMLMRSMEHIVATRLTAEQANAAEIERLREAARHLLDIIEAQGRNVTPAPKRETLDDANSRDERDQVFGDAIKRLDAAIGGAA